MFFPVGDAMLLLFNAEETRRGHTLPSHGASGPGHVALGVKAGELDAWRSRLTEHGVTIEQEVDWPRGAFAVLSRSGGQFRRTGDARRVARSTGVVGGKIKIYVASGRRRGVTSLTTQSRRRTAWRLR